MLFLPRARSPERVYTWAVDLKEQLTDGDATKWVEVGLRKVYCTCGDPEHCAVRGLLITVFIKLPGPFPVWTAQFARSLS